MVETLTLITAKQPGSAVLPPLEMPSASEEIHHRIANHLQLLEASVRFEAMRRDEPGLATILAAISDRISAIATVHRQLYRDPGCGTTLDLAAFVDELVEGLGRSIDPVSGALFIERVSDPIEAAAADAALVGIMITELVANACKHAHVAGTGGRVVVRLAPLGGAGFRLAVEDNGRGKPGHSSRSGLGTRLIDAIARQLGATYAWHDAAPGARFVMERPSPA